jgi:L-fuculose-phosphate aldolase
MNSSGLNQGTSGNISVRYDGGMLITPSGIPYEKLSEEQIVFVDQNGTSEAGKVPSSEWRFHLGALQARPEMHAVVHTHALHATAVSILNREIPAIHYTIAFAQAHSIPCVPYATYGTETLTQYVIAGIQKSKAILLQHHGMIAVGANLDKALHLAHEVEVLAKMYLTLLPLGKVPTLSRQEIDLVIKKFENYGLRKD